MRYTLMVAFEAPDGAPREAIEEMAHAAAVQIIEPAQELGIETRAIEYHLYADTQSTWGTFSHGERVL